MQATYGSQNIWVDEARRFTKLYSDISGASHVLQTIEPDYLNSIGDCARKLYNDLIRFDNEILDNNIFPKSNNLLESATEHYL